jgi:hypothetical protein
LDDGQCRYLNSSADDRTTTTVTAKTARECASGARYVVMMVEPQEYVITLLSPELQSLGIPFS